MASTVKRLASGVLAVWFTVFSVVFPVTAHAVTYNAASNFTGRIWTVPFVGTGIAGSRIAASAATVITRANPWISGIAIGTALVQTVIELKTGGTIGLVSDGQLTTPIPGWGDSNSPPPIVAPLSGSGTGTSTSTYPAPLGINTTPGQWVSPTGTIGDETFACFSIYSIYTPGTDITLTEAGRAAYGSTTAKVRNCASPTNPTASYIKQNYICPAGGVLSGVSLAGANCINAPLCPTGTARLPSGVCGAGVTCPPGYAVSGSSCSLTDSPPVQWPSDGQPTYVPRVGDNGVYQWWPSDRDPDQGTYPQANINAALQSGDVFSDPDGNPVTQSFTPNSDGGYTFTQSIQHSPAGSGNTYTTTNNYTVNKQGNVTNLSTVTHNGPITNVNSGSGPVQLLPTDYNREATQAAIKESINKLATGEGAQDAPDFKKDVEDKKTAMDKGITDFTDAIPGQFAESKGNWFSWVWSPPVGQCSPYEGNIHGKSVTWNICPHIATARDVIGWLFALYGAWTVYNQMFRKDES